MYNNVAKAQNLLHFWAFSWYPLQQFQYLPLLSYLKKKKSKFWPIVTKKYPREPLQRR